MKVPNVSKYIKDELLIECEAYKLSTIECITNDGETIDLIELTTENVRKVEKMLLYNSNYPQFIDYNSLNDEEIFTSIEDERKSKDAGKEKEFNHSSMEYIAAFKYAIDKNKLKGDKGDKAYRYYIKSILRKIASENSTHTSNQAVEEITNRICDNLTPNQLLAILKEPYEKDSYDKRGYDLIKCISKEADGKHHFSLATKFCHYLNMYFFFNTDYVDLFSIYDSIVKENIIYYYNYYVSRKNKELKERVKNIDDDKSLKGKKYKYTSSDLKNKNEEYLVSIYKTYQEIIDEIIAEAKISRNGFDHLLWYTGRR